jgi:acyl-coenzyme A synthetase/AMP-(fatty) acid ligase
MPDLPLIRRFQPGDVFAIREGREVSVEEYLGEVRSLAQVLPDRRFLVNLCGDRYRFAVGFAAALVRNQVSLLPSNTTEDLLSRLSRDYPGVYCLSDGGVQTPAGDVFNYPSQVIVSEDMAKMPAIPGDQLAAIGFTSGSTGRPTPHAKSWRALAGSGRAEFERLGLGAYRGMSLLATVPQQHMYGLESTVLMVMQGGLAMHSGRPFFPADICADLQKLRRPRALVTTPVHLKVLLAETGELPPVDFLLCATAPLSPQLATEAEARFGAPLHEIYGCTEAGQVATRRPAKTHLWQMLPGISLRQDERGTWVKGGHVETGVLLSDVIVLCESDTFELHGRTGDLVNIAGKRTSLAHLNFQLNSIEGVRDGAFVMPEEDNGTVTRLTAFVVAPGVTGEAIVAALRQRVDPVFLPRPLFLVDSLPRNETGKLPRAALDDLAARVSAKGNPH